MFDFFSLAEQSLKKYVFFSPNIRELNAREGNNILKQKKKKI